MQDRISTHPGRVTLTPVAGQANTFDMVRADEPTQQGTPLNKGTLLKDATAALYGLTNAVPDDVFNKLSNGVLHKPLYGDLASTCTKEALNELGAGVACVSQPIWDELQGKYIPQGTSYNCDGASYNTTGSQAPTLPKSWVYRCNTTYSSIPAYYYITNADQTKYYTGGTTTASDSIGLFTGAGKQSEHAPAGNNYTDVLGNVLGNAVSIETGSYVGTGTCGESNPNSLTFGFAPKLVYIYKTDGRNTYQMLCGAGAVRTSTAYSGDSGTAAFSRFSSIMNLNGNQLTWFYYGSTSAQLNEAGGTYNYTAIG